MYFTDRLHNKEVKSKTHLVFMIKILAKCPKNRTQAADSVTGSNPSLPTCLNPNSELWRTMPMEGISLQTKSY